MSNYVVHVPIRIVQSIDGATIAHPLTREPLHLLNIAFPNGDVLDGVALTNAQVVDLVGKLNHLLSEGLNHEILSDD